MAKHKRAESKVNTEGWMMSYADMATILLAMFIVLTTLGKDQTGVKLQKGLESWRESRQFFGLSGIFSGSGQVTQLPSTGPTYHLNQDNPEEKGESNSSNLDGETERFQHFLQELDRQFDVSALPRPAGQATVDLFDPLNKQSPYLSAKQLATTGQILPLLRQPDYRVVLIVWATMPSESAMVRAADQAFQVGEDLKKTAGLDASAWKRFEAIGQSWRYPNYQRPVFSLLITKTASKSAPQKK